MVIGEGGTVAQIPPGVSDCGFSIPALARLLTKAVLYVAPGAAFPTCTGDNNKSTTTTTKRKEGGIKNKQSRIKHSGT